MRLIEVGLSKAILAFFCLLTMPAWAQWWGNYNYDDSWNNEYQYNNQYNQNQRNERRERTYYYDGQHNDPNRGKSFYVTASDLNVRASSDGRITGKYAKGTRVVVTRSDGNWMEVIPVDANGKAIRGAKPGYVYRTYLSGRKPAMPKAPATKVAKASTTVPLPKTRPASADAVKQTPPAAPTPAAPPAPAPKIATGVVPSPAAPAAPNPAPASPPPAAASPVKPTPPAGSTASNPSTPNPAPASATPSSATPAPAAATPAPAPTPTPAIAGTFPLPVPRPAAADKKPPAKPAVSKKLECVASINDKKLSAPEFKNLAKFIQVIKAGGSNGALFKSKQGTVFQITSRPQLEYRVVGLSPSLAAAAVEKKEGVTAAEFKQDSQFYMSALASYLQDPSQNPASNAAICTQNGKFSLESVDQNPRSQVDITPSSTGKTFQLSGTIQEVKVNETFSVQ